MIDAAILSCSSNHSLAAFGIINTLDRSQEGSSVRTNRNCNKSRIPIVYCQHVLLSTIDGKIASRGTTSINRLANLVEFSIWTKFVGKYLSVLLNIFSTCIDNVEAWM